MVEGREVVALSEVGKGEVEGQGVTMTQGGERGGDMRGGWRLLADK